MTESREFNAATVDEAVAKASKQLGVPADELAYELIDEGSPGFLGIGARDARISVDETGGTQETSEEASESLIKEPDPASEEEPRKDEEVAKDDSAHTHEQEPETNSTVVPEDLLSEIKKFASETVSSMGFEARIDVYDAGDFVAVDVSPEDTGLFIGQKGETIDAFQHLLNVSVYKHREFLKRVIVDSEGYRQRRIEAVQGMAHRMARRAAREGRVIELPPMSSSERRVVHTYLKENSDVSTESEGSGENRRVNISPRR